MKTPKPAHAHARAQGAPYHLSKSASEATRPSKAMLSIKMPGVSFVAEADATPFDVDVDVAQPFKLAVDPDVATWVDEDAFSPLDPEKALSMDHGFDLGDTELLALLDQTQLPAIDGDVDDNTDDALEPEQDLEESLPELSFGDISSSSLADDWFASFSAASESMDSVYSEEATSHAAPVDEVEVEPELSLPHVIPYPADDDPDFAFLTPSPAIFPTDTVGALQAMVADPHDYSSYAPDDFGLPYVPQPWFCSGCGISRAMDAARLAAIASYQKPRTPSPLFSPLRDPAGRPMQWTPSVPWISPSASPNTSSSHDTSTSSDSVAALPAADVDPNSLSPLFTDDSYTSTPSSASPPAHAISTLLPAPCGSRLCPCTGRFINDVLEPPAYGPSSAYSPCSTECAAAMSCPCIDQLVSDLEGAGDTIICHMEARMTEYGYMQYEYSFPSCSSAYPSPPSSAPSTSYC
ncbi:hypothetical protein EXIGLDRAFT_762693 [Exidia glandulosa HHB12029]|uniref:Uncharacterized protein n=1 Tax=Exidia glandulosa HHB12029 TaxID=1314781 RepID=A0A165MKC3_EXIGL|nr:hypothetical protein EXIGLDRAFT_762693 [Exidia glandulosa HHB12029]